MAEAKSGRNTQARKTAQAKAKAEAEAGGPAVDAVALLTADHRQVESWFEQYERLSEKKDDGKYVVAEQIILALDVHTQIEEEIFYPAIREAVGEQDMVDEAVVEHQAAKHLMGEIEGGAEDDLYDAKVKVLSEEIEHHVKEEETEMFVKARESGLDLMALGERMAARKTELMTQFGEDAA